MSSRRCFVISPIGADGSAVRQHADDVFDYIIKPAVTECGLVAHRSDHLLEPGKISEQMFKEIITGDCCIVFGSEGNGLSPQVLAACDEAVAIPMSGGVDSLNVSPAAAVFLYEAARQRDKG